MKNRTLLLTPWWVPLQVIHWQDAVRLIYEEKVVVMVEYDQAICSPSVEWKMPAVIRLRSLERTTMKNGVKFCRENVYARDHYRCQYCGEHFAPESLTYDHVVPKSAGGRRTWTNIATACLACNQRKGKRTCDEAGMFPLRTPVQPKSLPIRGPRIDPESAPAEWQDFIGAWAR